MSCLVIDTTQYDELYPKEYNLDVDNNGRDLISRLNFDGPLSLTPLNPQKHTVKPRKSNSRKVTHTKGQHQSQTTKTRSEYRRLS